MKNFYSWYKKHITTAIFIGLILGILTGLFLAGRFEPVLTITSLIGSIYMNALNMMIFPLVFCSIIMGISSIGNARTTGKITAGAMIFFLCTTALASLAGLIIPRLIHLGEGVKFEMATSDIQATEMTSILDTIKNLIPSNPVAAFANGNMLQVLVFAVIVGFTLIAIGEKGAALLFHANRCLLYNRSCCRSQRYRNNRFTCNPADHSVCSILRICNRCLRRCYQTSWKRKSNQILQDNASSSIKRIRNLLQFSNHSDQ